MEFLEFQWLRDEVSLKEALKDSLGASGQLIKKHFSSKQSSHPIRARDISRLPIDFVNHGEINPLYTGPQVKILAETSTYLAIHKPSNVHCHPLSYTDKNTLLNFLVSQNIWAPVLINKESYDRGLLYRLDYETSGVMLLAKSNELYQKVRQDFNTHMKRKFYWAIVEGDFDKDGLWTHYLKGTGVKSAKQKVYSAYEPEAHEGTLAVKKVLSQNEKSLLLINLKTGLRHQIRAQLASLGFPILGDELYGGVKSSRLFLHALRYEGLDVVEDSEADLFNSFFDLNSALQMTHDMIRRF